MAALFVYSVALLTLCSGSRVVFRQDPVRVAEVLTKTLRLRCALEDSGAQVTPTSAPVSGMTLLAVGTQTAQYVDTITSIEITRDGERLAFLDQNSTYPQAEGDYSNLKVIGDLSLPQTLSERAFLELTWSAPSYNQSGEYTCIINATTSPSGGMFNFEVMAEMESSSRQNKTWSVS
ncbi:hypothetical protein EGW08_008026 [Elysia chlorotica]|uniref:Reelin domain-containing protein n=1 Tax=Elysia chlorotica TaxID=188477 RepID=A0A433TRJ6_ELYCH|nr:hypothetical protein EGW08_008026 [Elysia chlorotica]